MGNRLQILVTKRAMELISDPTRNVETKQAVESAIKLSEGVDYSEPRTRLIEKSPLSLHIDPTLGIIIILATFPGWPVVRDNLVDELIPLTTVVNLA
jgi:hypothetical protein